MSLRWKIALALAVVAAAATTMIGVLGYRTTHDRLYDTLDRSLVDAADQVQASRGRSLPVRGLLDVYVIQIVGADGTIVGERGDTHLPVAIGQSMVGEEGSTVRTVEAGGDRYRVLTVGAPRSALQIARPLAETDEVLGHLRTRTMAMVGLVSLAAALIGWLIATTFTVPLMRLTRAAEAVGTSGRLDVDVDVEGRDEVGRLGATFQRMLAALARSRDDQRRLVQDAGHELRTPLTSLRTNLDVLRRYPDLDDATRHRIVDDLHSETEELVALVNEVVAAASGTAQDAEPEEVALGPLARTVAERVARRTGREIVVDVDESRVSGQRALLERAVSNLLDNAAKFDPGPAPISITVRAGRVDVADRGPGIPDEDLAQVFDRFHRAVGARSLPGSGVGLSIVREIAETHGGTVSATNRAGGGAVVGFLVPVLT